MEMARGEPGAALGAILLLVFSLPVFGKILSAYLVQSALPADSYMGDGQD